MSDNVPISPGSGAVVATDDIGGTQFQRMKISHGVDGVYDGDTAKTNPLPTRMATSLTRDFTTVPVDCAASGGNIIVPSVAGKTVKVYGWALKVFGAVEMWFFDNGISANYISPMPYANKGDGWVMDVIGQPYLISSVGGNFNIVLSAAVRVTGVVFVTQE